MRCIIIDDLPVARLGMQRLIERHEDLELAGSFDNATDALKGIVSTGAELVFADIRMPGLSGLDLARILPDNVLVIFTTAYSEYALESYDIGVIDYLVKPIDPERFDRAVAKALAARRTVTSPAVETDTMKQEDVLTIKSERRYVRIPLAEILYLEGNKDLVVIHLADRKVSTRATLHSVEEMLPRNRFIRVNKSFIVNKAKITAFDSQDIFIGRREIAVGPTYREMVMALLIP